MTELAQELQSQAMWRPRQGSISPGYLDSMARFEFLPPAELQDILDRQWKSLVAYSESAVPYYRERFASAGIQIEDFRGRTDIERLPILTKLDLLDHVKSLKSSSLPAGEKIFGWFRSSGTTGRRTRVLMTRRSNRMFSFALQRLMRWSRWDPMGTMAEIRPANAHPQRKKRGPALPDGETLRSPGWNYLARYFETGPLVACNSSNSLEYKLQWLRDERPDYLMTYPGTLESLAFLAQGRPVDSLGGIRSISSQVTGGMRRRIEENFQLPVQQNYGLNEIGIAANRCEAGRYHIEINHCDLEIVDEYGYAVPPGSMGRVLVTGFTNLAMPLLRYDTTDLAERLDGPCPCGRTLPGFGRLEGRFRAWKHTPAGTRQRVNLLIDTIDDMPNEWMKNLRQYQVHQYQDESYELRLDTRAALPKQFRRTIESAWLEAFGELSSLGFKEVDHIPPSPGGKQQQFTTDFLAGTTHSTTVQGG